MGRVQRSSSSTDSTSTKLKRDDQVGEGLHLSDVAPTSSLNGKQWRIEQGSVWNCKRAHALFFAPCTCMLAPLDENNRRMPQSINHKVTDRDIQLTRNLTECRHEILYLTKDDLPIYCSPSIVLLRSRINHFRSQYSDFGSTVT